MRLGSMSMRMLCRVRIVRISMQVRRWGIGVVGMRIIVTGCRDWKDAESIERALYDAMLPDEVLVVVHGASGNADRAAGRWAMRIDLVEEEPHPADWDRYGKKAGPLRNSDMAASGADLCLAFWDGKSRGTLDMITKAARAGIPVRIVPKGK